MAQPSIDSPAKSTVRDALRFERFASDRTATWNEFIARSKNGTFLLNRGYMDYHADRFTDHSLLVHDGGRLVAVFPANERDGALVSHGGLTYGGLITDDRMRTALMLKVLTRICDYAREAGFTRLIYKPVPHIYHQQPAEEDLYALFRLQARLFRRDVSTTVNLANRLGLTKGRKWGINKARSNGIAVVRSEAFESFMEMETALLQEKYGTTPTHSSAEMRLLADRFPNNIKLFTAVRDQELLAGVLVYETVRVAHAQYIASSAQGRDACALDAICDYLLSTEYREHAWFDFGISTEQGGQWLNEGLIENKESYGGRAIAYDQYEIPVG